MNFLASALVLINSYDPLISGCLYYLIWQTLAFELAIPELIYQTLVPAYNRINSILIVGTPIIFGAILFLAIRFSNRFAGPVQRIEDELDKMIKSRDFQHTVRIRPSDDLAPLIRKMNQVIRGANGR